jgi:hypothetical protein
LRDSEGDGPGEPVVVNENGERMDALILANSGRPRPGPDYEPYHLNGDPLDCRRANLEWRQRDTGRTRRMEAHMTWLDENHEVLSEIALDAYRQAGRGLWLASEDPDGGVDLVYKTQADIDSFPPSPEKDSVRWKVEQYDPESEFVIGLNEPCAGTTSFYRVSLDWESPQP